MALVFKTPKTAINTTTRDIQNIKDGECPPCPECPEVELTTADVEYTENGSFTVTPESGFDGLSQVDITVNIDTQSIADEAYAEGEAAGIVTGKAQGVAEQKAKLTSTTLTTNGTVTREDGWNEVTVNVDTTTPYNEGVAAGIAEQKAKLTSLNVTSNGTYNKEDGYNAVTVDVQPELEAKTVSYASNGEYTITPTTGKYGISEATITVDVPSDVNNQNKTVSPTTSSQSVTADSGYSGLGTVTVEAVTSSIDANIAAGNIKSGVTILGVTGTVTEGIIPTGNINITNTNSTDVTNYATAQVVDANLTAGNIKSGTTILGVEGSYDPQPDLETKSVTYTANDTYTITPTAGKDGMSSVEVTVNVAGGGGTQCPDWSSIGWDCNDVNGSKLANDVELAAQNAEKYRNGNFTQWPTDSNIVPKITLKDNCSYLFSSRNGLRYWPKTFDGQPTNAREMFSDAALDHIPSFDMSEITNAYGMFSGTRHTFKTATVNLPKATDVTNLFYRGVGAPASSSLTSATIYAPLATKAEQILYGHSQLTELNLTLGTLSGVNRYMFAQCTSLQSAPLIDTSLATDLGQMFWGCSSLTTVPLYDLSSATTIEAMFSDCTALVSIPQFNTSNVRTIGQLFTNCTSLTTIPLLDFSKVSSFTGSIRTAFYNCRSLTTLGGLLNAGKAFTGANAAAHTIDLSSSTVLTKESIMNVINNLAAPDDTTVTDATLKLSATSYALLTAEDIAIATAKNWSVVSA